MYDTTDADTYGIDVDDVLLNLNGYDADSIEIVEVRGQKEYDEIFLQEDTHYSAVGGYGFSSINFITLMISPRNKLGTFSISKIFDITMVHPIKSEGSKI